MRASGWRWRVGWTCWRTPCRTARPGARSGRSDWSISKMALAPTLSLWRVEMERAQLPQDVRDAFIAEGLGQLRAFAAGKGEVLFGTDVGYIPEAGADEEVARMTDAGMGWADILRSLGEAPARRFRDPSRGMLQPGGAADLVLVEGDPRTAVLALTRVRQTWVAGRSVFAR